MVEKLLPDRVFECAQDLEITMNNGFDKYTNKQIA